MVHRKQALAALAALGDPNRRLLFERLASKPLPVGALSEGLPISRSAVSQHLKILKSAGLVGNVTVGTRHVYYLDPHGIGAMRTWLERFFLSAQEHFAPYNEQSGTGE